MSKLIRFAFTLLYTHFAWLYDLVATSVSFGEWKTWGAAALRFIPTSSSQTTPAAPQHPIRVLEIAHGPGHLHMALYKQGYSPIGIDLSPQMGRMAYWRCARGGVVPRLARADVMRLPFADASFDCLIATFPTEFISAQATLREARRVLAGDGVFVIVPSITLTGNGPLPAFIRWLYRITNQQSGRKPAEIVQESAAAARFAAKVAQLGFALNTHQVPTQHAEVTVWVLRKQLGLE
ncbi:MAG: methyltransferase domain-containing protein [Anaerolineae bacterium]|nr:methyltransferase domain-containing protein [Anaerolineae bacterium]